MTKVVLFAFSLGLAFLEAGKIRQATYHMALLAFDAQRHQISLGDLNRQLYGETHSHRKATNLGRRSDHAIH